jgi:methylthioribose-1-phosphate isomerase
MTALDTTMLAAMREAIAELLPDKCTILSVTNAPDGMGGVTQTWGTALSNVDFRLDVVSGREQVSGGGMQPFTSLKGSLPYDTVITAQDRIVHNGVTYAITGVNNNQSWVAVRRVDLEKV